MLYMKGPKPQTDYGGSRNDNRDTVNANQYQINFRPPGLLRLVFVTSTAIADFFFSPKSAHLHARSRSAPGPRRTTEQYPLTLRAPNIRWSTSSAINFAWNGAETPDHSACRPCKGIRRVGRGCGSILDLSPPVSKQNQTGKAIAAGLLDAICLIYSAIRECQ